MTKEYKTTEAQRAAIKRYRERNPEATKIIRYRGQARTFARHHATLEEMEELMDIFKKENPNAKNDQKA